MNFVWFQLQHMMQTCFQSFTDNIWCDFFCAWNIKSSTENSSSCIGPDGESSLAISSKTQGEVQQWEGRGWNWRGLENNTRWSFELSILLPYFGWWWGRTASKAGSLGGQQISNQYFNWKDMSCLHLIAKSDNKVRLND